MRKIVGVVAIGLVALSGCGGPSEQSRQAEIEQWLTDHQATPEEARCLAQATAGRFDISDFEKLAESPDTNDEEGLASILEAAREKCGR